MEVKIGVLHTPREIVIESAQSQDEVEKAVAEALSSESKPLTLSDEKGRRILVPANLVAYVEIAQADVRRVGFATL